MANILVTGGAGYIGSHTLRSLRAAGHHVFVYDSLEKGHRSAITGFPLIHATLQEQPRLEQALREHEINAVIHFAAYIEAGESVRDPGRYFANNTAGTLSLLRAMVASGVERIVFSSTAAVY